MMLQLIQHANYQPFFEEYPELWDIWMSNGGASNSIRHPETGEWLTISFVTEIEEILDHKGLSEVLAGQGDPGLESLLEIAYLEGAILRGQRPNTHALTEVEVRSSGFSFLPHDREFDITIDDTAVVGQGWGTSAKHPFDRTQDLNLIEAWNHLALFRDADGKLVTIGEVHGMNVPYSYKFKDAFGTIVQHNYPSYAHYLAFNYKFPSGALDVLRHDGTILNKAGDIITQAPNPAATRDTWVIPLGNKADGTELEELTLMDYMHTNDLVRYVSSGGIELMQDTVDKMVKWAGQAPVLWTGTKNVVNWWFKIGIFTYKTFGLISRWIKIIGSAL